MIPQPFSAMSKSRASPTINSNKTTILTPTSQTTASAAELSQPSPFRDCEPVSYYYFLKIQLRPTSSDTAHIREQT